MEQWDYRDKAEIVFRQLVEYCRWLERDNVGEGAKAYTKLMEESGTEINEKALEAIKNPNNPYTIIHKPKHDGKNKSKEKEEAFIKTFLEKEGRT